jgi:hypothetical protein
LSAIPLDQKKLMDTLDEVAQFHQPKVQEHGYYQLKFKYWKQFDPLFAHFYPNELEDAQVCKFIIFPHFFDFMMGC